jgi:hypothetical protein
MKIGSEGGKALVERYGKTDRRSNFHIGIAADQIAKHGKTDDKSNFHMETGSSGGTAHRNNNHDEHMKKSGGLQLKATFDDCNHSVIRPVSVLRGWTAQTPMATNSTSAMLMESGRHLNREAGN